MKKIIVFLMISVFLSACGSTSSQNLEQPNKDVQQETTTTQKNTEANKGKRETGMGNDEVNYEEMVIWETLIPVNDYSPRVVEDNNQKRIILFEDENGQVSYKSIYIKKKDRLKVIETNTDDGLLYNDKI
ncbi:hypothetical protein [Oceanobacillus sp. Castelsardo]|uniref:hypothetical protein n=1 Tax=Oceanobacillus sp. Castelsardo TaxID=1851204 RepID=UPI00083843C6|nr:hypothetical protein [Oceanobacillus sp. Castelsardo]